MKPYTACQKRDLVILREAHKCPVSPWRLASSSLARFKKEGLVEAVAQEIQHFGLARKGRATYYILSEAGRAVATAIRSTDVVCKGGANYHVFALGAERCSMCGALR